MKSVGGIGTYSNALNAYQRSGNGYGRGNGNSNGNSSGNSNAAGNSNGRGNVNQPRGGGRGFSNSDKRPTYFCDHCKIQGHSFERCFKIHGYPNQRNDRDKQNKGNGYSANTSQGESNSASGSSSGDHTDFDQTPHLTREQYNQLIALLSKQDFSESSNRANMMAGMPL